MNPIGIIKSRGLVLILALLALFLLPDIVEARRGGRSFGRRSFGRRSTAPKKSRGSSFGKKSTRNRNSSNTTARRSSFNKATPTGRIRSAGGKQLSSKQQYTSTYGTPRKTTTRSIPVTGANGKTTNQSYRMHSYGGYGSGLMTGYMLGTIPWYWSMPFHPAFYYSAPQYHKSEDGSVDVYPGRFSFSKMLVGIILIGGAVFVIYRLFFRRKGQQENYTEYSRGSFG